MDRWCGQRRWSWHLRRLWPARPRDKATKGMGTVVGRVIDLEGRPVAGAEVWAGDRNQVAARSRSGADGRFRLGPVSDERAATVWAEDEERGLAREHFEDVRVFAGRETDLGDVALCPEPGSRATSWTSRGDRSRGPERRS